MKLSEGLPEGTLLTISPGRDPRNDRVYCFVRNMSGLNLVNGTLVCWQKGCKDRRVILADGVDWSAVAGAVSRDITAIPRSGVPPEGMMWIQVKGLARVKVAK